MRALPSRAGLAHVLITDEKVAVGLLGCSDRVNRRAFRIMLTGKTLSRYKFVSVSTSHFMLSH
jgi:hypothetical protein